MEDPSFEHFLSRRLVIRRFASGDAEALAAYRSDAEVARYQSWECPYSVSEARQFIASLHDVAPGTPGTWFQFAVSLQSSGPLIGDVALRTRKADARQAELGFTFATVHQRQGFATEAVGAVVRYAFESSRCIEYFPRLMCTIFARSVSLSALRSGGRENCGRAHGSRVPGPRTLFTRSSSPSGGHNLPSKALEHAQEARSTGA